MLCIDVLFRKSPCVGLVPTRSAPHRVVGLVVGYIEWYAASSACTTWCVSHVHVWVCLLLCLSGEFAYLYLEPYLYRILGNANLGNGVVRVRVSIRALCDSPTIAEYSRMHPAL